jgi:hypothetical protein
MNDAVMGTNPAHQPMGPLVGERLNLCPLFSRCAGGGVVEITPRAEGVTSSMADSPRHFSQRAIAGRLEGEIRQTSICKSLQVSLAPRAINLPRISVANFPYITTLFFSELRITEKGNEGLDLALHLHYRSADEHANSSNGFLQLGAGGGLFAQPERSQTCRGRGCASHPRVDPSDVQSGVGFHRSRCWRHATRTGAGGVGVA